MTITELMAGKAPGTIKIRSNSWKDDYFFVPYFMHRFGCVDRWYGDVTNTPLIDDKHPYFVDTDGWELYVEPMTKTIRYEWMIHNQLNNDWYLYARLRTEAEMNQWVKLNGHSKVRKTGRQFEFEGIADWEVEPEQREFMLYKRNDGTIQAVVDAPLFAFRGARPPEYLCRVREILELDK